MTRPLVTALVGLFACGTDSPPRGDATMTDDANTPDDATTIDVNPTLCAPIGMVCDASCPSPLECVHNRCVPVRGDCGGIVGAECQDTSLVCTYPQGSSGGICMQPDEKECVCSVAPGVLADCALSER